MALTWQIIVVLLLAVLVGFVVPVLIQLRKTLKSAESVLQSTGPKLDRTLDEVGEAAERINRIGKGLERDVEGLREFTDTAVGLARSLKKAQDSMRMVASLGAAVGPAIAAGLRALFSPNPFQAESSSSWRGKESVTDNPSDAGSPAAGRPASAGEEASIGHE